MNYYFLKEGDTTDYKIVIHNGSFSEKEEVNFNHNDFDQEELGYIIENRNILIDSIYDLIPQAQNAGDRYLMKEDIKYLDSLNDDFVFSDINTNDYIASSDDEEDFNAIIEELLSLLDKKSK